MRQFISKRTEKIKPVQNVYIISTNEFFRMFLQYSPSGGIRQYISGVINSIEAKQLKQGYDTCKA